MALTVTTSNPAELLTQIKSEIDIGTIRTWRYNSKGHFTHTAPQWKEQAWLKPILSLGCLQFEIVLPKWEVKPGVEGVYQGRFCTMLQNHFDYTATVTSTLQQATQQQTAPVRNSSRRGATSRKRTQPTTNRRKATGRGK